MGNPDSMEKQQNRNHLQQQQPPPPPRLQIQLHQSQHQQLQQMHSRAGENGLTKTPDRIKRDEWSEGAVGTLLDAYESKWLLRNRAKLKGNDWEDVARQVSLRNSGIKSHKTQSQSKNKIESMKKRYRAEAASICNPGSGSSSWPFYSRMDGLLRCSTVPQARPGGGCADAIGQPALTDLGLQALPKVEIGDSELVFKGVAEIRANPGEFTGRNSNHLTVVEPEGQMQNVNVAMQTVNSSSASVATSFESAVPVQEVPQNQTEQDLARQGQSVEHLSSMDIDGRNRLRNDDQGNVSIAGSSEMANLVNSVFQQVIEVYNRSGRADQQSHQQQQAVSPVDAGPSVSSVDVDGQERDMVLPSSNTIPTRSCASSERGSSDGERSVPVGLGLGGLQPLRRHSSKQNRKQQTNKQTGSGAEGGNSAALPSGG